MFQWESHLLPHEDRSRSMHPAGLRYLLGKKPKGFQSDYAGNRRQKLAPPGAPFQDFVVWTDYAEGSKGRRALIISLLCIKSPGLTASLALAEMGRRSKTNDRQ